MDNLAKYNLNTLTNDEWITQIDKINKESLLKFTLFNKKFQHKITLLIKQIIQDYTKPIILNEYVEKTVYWILKVIKINIPSIINKITFIIISTTNKFYKTFLPFSCTYDCDIFNSYTKYKHLKPIINLNFNDITKDSLIKFNLFLNENKINLIYLGFINKHIKTMKKFLNNNFENYSIKKISCDKFTSYILRSNL